MVKELFLSISQNKNILMLCTVSIYILALFVTLTHVALISAFIFTIFISLAYVKNILPLRVIIVWMLVFYIGIVNTIFRLKDTDALLNLAPVNSTIYGKILTIPQNKGDGKIKFFFNVDKIEYGKFEKTFKNEKTLVSLDYDGNKFKIYDSYKIRGRLSVPFKAGNPSQFDYGDYLKNFNTYSVFYGHNLYEMRNLSVPCYEKISAKITKTESILQSINDFRERIIINHSKYINSPNVEILGGIVFGDDAVSPPDNIRQSFINSGLLHILAASGMNVAFIYSFFFFLLNFCKVPFRFNIIACIVAVIAYVFMTGLGASVVRAALMLLFVLVGKLIDRDAHSISLLSFVAFLMLLYNPMFINDVGFQLSFIVTFGLLIMTPYLLKSKNRFVNWIIGTISIPIIAQLWVIPIQIFYFNNISVYSVFANIMSVPIVSIISFGGFISSLLAIITPVSDFICSTFDVILNPLITLLVNISDYWGQLPHSSLQTTHPSAYQIILYYLILLHIVGFIDEQVRRKYHKYLACTLIFVILVLVVSVIPKFNNDLEITAFDVGNADAFLLKTPANKYIMVDTGKGGYNGGKTQAKIIMLKYFRDNGIRNIDKLIITHFDNDHCGGAVDIIKGMNVNEIYVNSINHTSNAANLIYKTAKERKTRIIEAVNNQLVLADNGLKIINYISKDTAGIGDNESSIITLLTYKDYSMLFTGDAGVESLQKVKYNLPQNITILKVGHHGAAGVVNKEMVDYLKPMFSVISTGENKFGHPSVYTIETLQKSNILRTDINNSIKFIINDNAFKVLTYDIKRRKYIFYNRKPQTGAKNFFK